MKKLGLLVMPLMIVSLLASCNNGGGQDPVVYHTLKFVSETCYMKDDIGGQVEEKQFEAGEIANFHLVPHEGYLLPLENQVDFKDTESGEDFDGTYSYNPSNGDVSVKMTADVTIYAGNSVDSHYVNEEEYNHAISLEGVVFLQSEKINDDNKKVLYDFSSTIYHMYAETTKREKYVVKSGDSYSKYSRDFDIKEEFKREEAEAEDFENPQTFKDINPKLLLDKYKIAYGDLHYDSNRGLYVAKIEERGEVLDLELAFKDKKITNISLFYNETPYQILNYVYEEKTPVLPCTLDFSSETCELKKDAQSEAITQVIVNNGTTLNYIIEPKQGYVLPLENQIDFKITGTTDDFEGEHSYNPDTGEVSITLTDNVTITCQSEVDPSYVSQEEFDNAISFKDVQYLQVDGQEDEDFEPFEYYKQQMSPTFFHILKDVNPVNSSNGDEYEDSYYRKNEDGTCDSCSKNKSSKPYSLYFNVDPDHFVTPQTYLPIFETSFLGALEYLGLSYNSFNYIDFGEQRIYKAEFSDILYVGSGEIIFRFQNKKLVYFELTTDDGMAYYISYTYNQETPEFPIEIDEAQIPELSKGSAIMLHAQDGAMYIRITNAKSYLKEGSVLYAAYCKLSGESSISLQTPKVFSDVEVKSKDGSSLFVQYTVESIEQPTFVCAEEWYVNFSAVPTADDLYIVITINNAYESSETGRTAKQSYTGDVSCLLSNVDNGDATNTANLNISYDSITEQPTP